MSPENATSLQNAPDSDWSETEKQLLHQAFIEAIAHLREQRETHRKPLWLLFLESSGGTALIAAVLGALLVQWVSGSIQGHLKDREFQQTWMQARGNQALTAYKQELDDEQEIVKRAFALVGNAIQTSEDLIDLTGPKLSLKGYSGKERTKVADQRQRIRKAYNNADVEWRGQNKILALLMSLYYHGQPNVTAEWTNTSKLLSGYTDCAADWYDMHHAENTNSSDTVCTVEKKKLEEGLDRLSAALVEARSLARADWESPDRLIQRLEKANLR